ncbi:MAG TPA: cysteine hydrolase family protein [Bacteroidales bacterium]|nr:cysteine hydrolase family protein [Bacteroidales bacterium]
MKKQILILAILIFPMVLLYPQKAKPHTALVLIDIQAFYFDTTKMPLVGREEAAQKAAEILDYFRKNNMPVIHVRHEGGGDIRPEVSPVEGEKVIEKQQVNAFLGTDLLEYLRSMGITRLVLAGMQTHMCLEAATRAAADYGFHCTVISDACATRDLTYGDKTIKAEDVHYSTLATLEVYAKVMTAEEFLNAMTN